MNTVPSAAHFKHSNHVSTCSNHMFKMCDDRCYVNGNGSSGLEIISKSNIEFIFKKLNFLFLWWVLLSKHPYQ